jgi:hypothetical protein
MTIRNTYSAESWDKVYSAFQQINFTSYDYDTVKNSLIQYLKIYHAESFNDFIESGEMIALLEIFAGVAEMLAYRIDVMSHENFITTAQRKQSVLRLAKLISYTASRNIPARGLVKITSIRTTEEVYDSLGNNLANATVLWNDANNSNWKEQFFLVMNKVLTTKFGQPSKSFNISDVLMQLYTFNNNLTAFRNGVYAFSATDGTQMESVPIDIDENGPYERAPDLNAQFNIVYASDGKGDGSDYTGFLMFVKQGTLVRTDYTILEPSANRRVELSAVNVNDTDVWIYKVDDANVIQETWSRVETLNEQNLFFNDLSTANRKKYEVETLENDKIALLFGDGNFSDMPVGKFQLWTRVSLNQTVNVPKNRINGQAMSFGYVNQANISNSCALTFSLTAAIQNNAASETIEHIRQAAPATYVAQNRMVNGQDYNTYPLKDPTILRLKTINRTFAGQPKYIEWNDASRKYENTKLFGDDLHLFLDVGVGIVETTTNSKMIVDSYVEPLLQTNALLTALTHALVSADGADGIITYPRRKFIEDNRKIYRDVNGDYVNPYGGLGGSVGGDGSLNEKTVIQGALDRHYYGEPLEYITVAGTRYGVIPNPLIHPEDDSKIYADTLPLVRYDPLGAPVYIPSDPGSGLQPLGAESFFGLRFHPFLKAFGGTGELTLNGIPSGLPNKMNEKEVFTIEMTSDATTFTVISNQRGALPNYSLAIGGYWSAQANIDVPIDFSISEDSAEAYKAGDAFIIDLEFLQLGGWIATIRTFGTSNSKKVNLSGWWQLITGNTIASISAGSLTADSGPNMVQQMTFDQSNDLWAWLFLIARSSTGTWTIYNRDMKIIAESTTTKFWYNQDVQIIDPDTKKPVYDKIRILRSNLDEYGQPLQKADIYDTVSLVYDTDGNINFNQIELLPSNTINFVQAGNTTPDNLLQFESFAKDSYQYGEYLNGSITWFGCDASGHSYEMVSYDSVPYDTWPYDAYGIYYSGNNYVFTPGNYVGQAYNSPDTGITIVRRRYVPAPISPLIAGNSIVSGCNLISGLDFMWQHFSPITNLIDPSVTNIHDSFILTRGYYDSMIDYVRGVSDMLPTPPTPLQLRTDYGYLLKNKMLSDTVVLHSGNIKLLFGSLADQRLRAKFKAVKTHTASFSDERIKSEIIAVINTFFDIQNWDFGDTFYATELISLIHQRLAGQIASVVLVPVYSVNSFGSLFTIESGFDEVLQSAATVNDVEIVDALTPSVLRQVK